MGEFKILYNLMEEPFLIDWKRSNRKPNGKRKTENRKLKCVANTKTFTTGPKTA